MVHIDQYTGLKRSQDKKMEASKERCGLALPDILVIGETTAKKVLVFSFTKITTNTKACGPWIRNMDKEHTGEMTVAS